MRSDLLWMKLEFPMSLLAVWFPIPVSPRYVKVLSFAAKNRLIFFLAVGGGSVIDSCKAIGYGLANPDTDVWNFFLRTETPKACLPVGVILTIAASGSEMSSSSVITNEETKEKTWMCKDRLLQAEICHLKSTSHLHTPTVSDRKRMCRYPHAHHGAIFCKY